MVILKVIRDEIPEDIKPILHNRKSTNSRESLSKTDSKDEKYQSLI